MPPIRRTHYTPSSSSTSGVEASICTSFFTVSAPMRDSTSDRGTYSSLRASGEPALTENTRLSPSAFTKTRPSSVLLPRYFFSRYCEKLFLVKLRSKTTYRHLSAPSKVFCCHDISYLFRRRRRAHRRPHCAISPPYMPFPTTPHLRCEYSPASLPERQEPSLPVSGQ